LDRFSPDEIWRTFSKTSNASNERYQKINETFPLFDVVFDRPLQNRANTLRFSDRSWILSRVRIQQPSTKKLVLNLGVTRLPFRRLRIIHQLRKCRCDSRRLSVTVRPRADRGGTAHGAPDPIRDDSRNRRPGATRSSRQLPVRSRHFSTRGVPRSPRKWLAASLLGINATDHEARNRGDLQISSCVRRLIAASVGCSSAELRHREIATGAVARVAPHPAVEAFALSFRVRRSRCSRRQNSTCAEFEPTAIETEPSTHRIRFGQPRTSSSRIHQARSSATVVPMNFNRKDLPGARNRGFFQFC
jgi:hypothetical protein